MLRVKKLLCTRALLVIRVYIYVCMVLMLTYYTFMLSHVFVDAVYTHTTNINGKVYFVRCSCLRYNYNHVHITYARDILFTRNCKGIPVTCRTINLITYTYYGICTFVRLRLCYFWKGACIPHT